MNSNTTSIVVIPIYQSEPDEWGKASFEQCCKILCYHPICIVTHSGVNISFYQQIAKQFGVVLFRENFNSKFFSDITGYNKLMLNKNFYRRFERFTYLLIYQLDAWVFRDELIEWCQKKYDYIGAPWIGENAKGEIVLSGVGNGGFSLRRVRHFIDVLSYKGPVRKSNQLKLKPSLKNNIYKVLYSLGYQNTISYLKKDPTLYEDIFISIFLSNTKLRAHIPEVEEACLFSFEQSPSYLFSKIKKLPFGCHAWRKFEYNSFWSNYIST